MPARWIIRHGLLGAFALLLTACGGVNVDEEAEGSAQPPETDGAVYVELPPVEPLGGTPLPATLPEDLVWRTNDTDPEFASPNAVRGGTFRTYMLAFPLTLRLVGPDSNGSFAGYLRYNNYGPIAFHPETRNPIPALATHWAFGDDGRTVFYRLNPEAKWSDGESVTADDFVFAVQFMRSEEIIAPWYNNHYTQRILHVRAYDDLTYGVLGADAKPQDEMLYQFSFAPVPQHFHRMSDQWITEYNWSPQPTTGPYVVGDVRKGKHVDMVRKDDWWANDLRYYRNRFNPDRVRVKVIRDMNTAWQHFLKGELDSFPLVLPNFWHDKAQGEEFDKGYIHKYWYYNRLPVASAGMYLNSAEPILEEREVRYGIAHAMNFDKVISTILRGDYERMPTFQLGFGEYDNVSIKAREFDLGRAAEHFEAAGFKDRDDAGIRVRTTDDGNLQRLSFRVTYGQPHHTPRLVVLKEEAKKAGLELALQLLDSSSAFKQIQEKKHQIGWMAWNTSGISPRYWEHFHSVNANKTQTNNITNHVDPAMDEMIMRYRSSADKEERIMLAHRLEQIVHDSGVVVPTFQVPYTREGAWRWVRLPEHMGTRSTGELFNDLTFSAGVFSSGGLFWIDTAMRQETLDGKKRGEAFEPVTRIDTTHRVPAS